MKRHSRSEPFNPWTEFACGVRRLKDAPAGRAAARPAGGRSLTRLAPQARNQPWIQGGAYPRWGCFLTGRTSMGRGYAAILAVVTVMLLGGVDGFDAGPMDLPPTRG